MCVGEKGALVCGHIISVCVCVCAPAGELSSVVTSKVKHQSAARRLSITLRVALLAKADYISG